METKYNHLILYYFSGTGNSKRAAGLIAETAEKVGVRTDLFNIDRFAAIEKPDFQGKALIGFCSPTHGFNLPPIMLKFIWRFPRQKNADVFVFNSRAGMKLHKFFTPGLSGAAQIFPALVLRLKGFRVVGMQPMDYPSNWISLHPGLRPKVVKSVVERCDHKTNAFAEKILSGKKVYKALLSLPIDLAVLPVTLGYYLVGRFALAKTFVATDACTFCGLCEKQCPVNAIKTREKRMFWSFNCESCMRCMNICPHRAIETAHGYVILIWALAFALLPPLVQRLVFGGEWVNFGSSLLWLNVLEILFEMLAFLVVAYIAYEILFFLMRFRWINRIVAYTSFTHWKFWRRYKARRLKKRKS